MTQRAATVVGVRGFFLLAALAGITDLLWQLVRDPLSTAVAAVAGPSGIAGLPFEGTLTAVCAGAALLGWVWISFGVVIVVARAVLDAARGDAPRSDSASGRSALGCCCPRLTRRIVLAVCGVAIGTGICTPAIADPAGQAGPSATVPHGGVTGLALPDRTVGAAGSFRAGGTVTVVAGDSLWVIAERLLPPSAGDHEITATWHQLLRANADRIGADPDLIFPGTRLLLPASGSRAPGAKPINERTSGERRS